MERVLFLGYKLLKSASKTRSEKVGSAFQNLRLGEHKLSNEKSPKKVIKRTIRVDLGTNMPKSLLLSSSIVLIYGFMRVLPEA